MAVHDERFKDKEPIWRAALRDAANLSGLHFKGYRTVQLFLRFMQLFSSNLLGLLLCRDEFEHEFIERITKQVLAIIKEDNLPIRAESRVQASYDSLSSFSVSRQYQHHVFLNFRGCDTLSFYWQSL
ncbi:hypothetical protein HN51_008270 [Arachis hypogaea]